MTFGLDLWPTDLNTNRGHLLIKYYLPTKFEASGAKLSWVISCTRWSRLAWPMTLTFDLNINRDLLLIQDYLPTTFEASGANHSWGISCTKLMDTDIPTDMCKAICPSFFKVSKGGGHKNLQKLHQKKSELQKDVKKRLKVTILHPTYF